MRTLIPRIIDILKMVLEYAPPSASMEFGFQKLIVESYCLNSSWKKTICKILLERYLSETDGRPEYAEDLLRLVQLVQNLLD